MSERSPGHRPKSTRAKRAQAKRANAERARGGVGAETADGDTGSATVDRTTAAKPSKSTNPDLTARGQRQRFATGSIDELLAQMQREPASAPMNGPGAVGDDTVHPIFERSDTKFSDRQVDSVFKAIRQSGVVEQIEARIASRKKKPGRPVTLSTRTLLVGTLLTAMDGRGCLCSEIARTLYFRLEPASMELLDVTALPTADTQTLQRQQQWRIERRVRSALRRLLAPLDPSIHPTGREVPWTDLRTRDRDLTPEEILDNHAALTLVCNRLLRTPFTLLPANVRKKYRGSACIDGTPLRLNTRGRGIDNTVASTDPNAGMYVRAGDHSDDGTPSIRKAFFAYDINLMVAACDWLGPRQFMPALPLAMHLDAPGVDPAGAARRVMADLASDVHEPRFLAGDGLYANATADTFHNPARELGWKLVLPILDDHLGVQGSSEGLVLVEGEWYCPSIPQILIDATKHFRNRAIDRATYLQRIDARNAYRARFKGVNTSKTQRWGCPASGSHPAVICALKPSSEGKKFIGGPVLGVRLKDRITPDEATQTNGAWPKPCRQESVTIDLRPGTAQTADLAKYLQDLPFGTDEHTNTYNTLRQSQEGLHGFAKDDAYEALGTPGKRRSRGYAAQSLFAAVLLAAAGIRKVRAFIRDAIRDADGNFYVVRHQRKGDHATTHLPPGTKGTRGDPEHDPGEPAERAA